MRVDGYKAMRRCLDEGLSSALLAAVRQTKHQDDFFPIKASSPLPLEFESFDRRSLSSLWVYFLEAMAEDDTRLREVMVAALLGAVEEMFDLEEGSKDGE